MNRETIIDMLWWYKIWQHSGSNHTRLNKNFPETQKRPMKFRSRQVIYTDNSVELGKAFEDLCWNHCTSTPHRSETNGIAEGAVRRVKEGTSPVLLQSRLGNEWWADSKECYCYLLNIQDLLSVGLAPYERRFGILINRPVIPFFCERSI